MKQHLLTILFTIFCLIVDTDVMAYNFTYIDKYGTKWYCNYINNKKEAEITYFNKNTYKGDLIIPSKVSDGSRVLSISAIGDEAFDYCPSLTSITIPNSVTAIGDYAFLYCSSLTSIAIPNSVTTIGIRAFGNCSSLKNITIPNSVITIGKEAFWECSSLTDITIPNSVTTIDNQLFIGCSSLTSIVIPNSVTTIGDMAFCECSSLASITIPNSVTSIGSFAFNKCSSLTSIVIPNSVTKIETAAFQECSSLINVTISNSVTKIVDQMFQDCSSLASITIPNSVTEIEYNAFYDCSKLESITFEGKLPSMSSQAISNTPLSTIYISDTEPSDLLKNPFPDRMRMTLYVPKGYKSVYENLFGWQDFGTILEWDAPAIGDDDGKRCVAPIISYANKEIVATSATEGAIYHITVYPRDNFNVTTDTGILPITAAYDITAYAEAEGYIRSEPTTATLYFINAKLESETGIEQVSSKRALIISTRNGNIIIGGLENGERVLLYSTNGILLDSATAIDSEALLKTQTDDVVIVKVGNEGMKVRISK